MTKLTEIFANDFVRNGNFGKRLQVNKIECLTGVVEYRVGIKSIYYEGGTDLSSLREGVNLPWEDYIEISKRMPKGKSWARDPNSEGYKVQFARTGKHGYFLLIVEEPHNTYNIKLNHYE